MSGQRLAIALAQELLRQRQSARREAAREEVARRRRLYRVATEPITVRLPFPPMVNHYWRSKVIVGHVSIYVSPEGQDYRKTVIVQWATVAATFEGPLAVRVDAVFPDQRRRDVDGLLKGLLDSLEHAGAYRDDSQIKLLVVEHVGTEAPGWVDVKIGPRPGTKQETLFGNGW